MRMSARNPCLTARTPSRDNPDLSVASVPGNDNSAPHRDDLGVLDLIATNDDFATVAAQTEQLAVAVLVVMAISFLAGPVLFAALVLGARHTY